MHADQHYVSLFLGTCHFISAACVTDAILVVDRSGSIGTENWQQVVKYMKDRVGRIDFTGASGNRLGIVVYSTFSSVACALQHNAADLLRCIDGIQYTGGWTNTAQGIQDAGTQLDQYSSSSRTRLIEGMLYVTLYTFTDLLVVRVLARRLLERTVPLCFVLAGWVASWVALTTLRLRYLLCFW